MTAFPARVRSQQTGILIDSATAGSRIGSAAAVNPPGVGGNRWISFGGDGSFPSRYVGKIKQAVHLAYELRKDSAYIDKFNAVVRETAVLKPLSFVEALDAAQLNYAETTKDQIARREVDEFYKAWTEAPGYKPEGGFTIAITSQVYIYKHALRWNVRHLAGLICHEIAHVAGSGASLVAEVLLLGPEKLGYPRSPK